MNCWCASQIPAAHEHSSRTVCTTHAHLWFAAAMCASPGDQGKYGSLPLIFLNILFRDDPAGQKHRRDRRMWRNLWRVLRNRFVHALYKRQSREHSQSIFLQHPTEYFAPDKIVQINMHEWDQCRVLLCRRLSDIHSMWLRKHHILHKKFSEAV